tara:strand:- start:679 stop:1320 length:642 start_codon:yes stop_codon:yes gene_type:complete
MTKSKQKYYTVWKGHQTGVFESWIDCKLQIKNFQGAQYKSFESKALAEAAFNGVYEDFIVQNKKTTSTLSLKALKKVGQPTLKSIAVDAASSGNPGLMEYRGVDTQTQKVLFHQGPFEDGTNNVGEFLALVHGLAFLKTKNSSRPLYTDSKTAISWVIKNRCNTKLRQTPKNKVLFELIDRAEAWLKNNSYATEILKWKTKSWGEIPADFGRK